jgi:hypothetical protein
LDRGESLPEAVLFQSLRPYGVDFNEFTMRLQV